MSCSRDTMPLSHDVNVSVDYEILQSTLRIPVATATPANNKSEGRCVGLSSISNMQVRPRVVC